jgi:hypothetical protein
MSNYIYTVVAYRYGEKDQTNYTPLVDANIYVVGCFDSFKDAQHSAHLEKTCSSFECEILKVPVNGDKKSIEIIQGLDDE